MVAILQRCTSANVKVEKKIVGEIEIGLAILLGIKKGDKKEDADKLAEKIVGLRIFNDEKDKMNLSIKEINGSALVISQFTLCADTKKGRRPSFIDAELPDISYKLYEYFKSSLLNNGVPVQAGKFGSMMDVELINNGPATFIINTREG